MMIIRVCTIQDIEDAITEYRDYRRGLGVTEEDFQERKAINGLIRALCFVRERMEQGMRVH